ncbi:helix-turn-helix transcriptional regulator [Tellurirhabdus bombi]|uniref:helix-turn-helix transcriptional regulator n=1 Tax=Tellurirhabdus bombi TaxID=2907205 RepID=UPI001F46B5D7|nr:AraC family transcriptional regulator [Tellurirhabdus bombi]
MTAPVLQASDIFDPSLQVMPAFETNAEACFRHPEMGQVQMKNTLFPHLQVMDMRWQTEKDFVLFDPTPVDAISVNFVLDGELDSRFKGLSHELPMRSQTHNLIHTPEAGHQNRIQGGQNLSMLLIGLDKNFFMSSIGHNDPWSEAILNNLEQGRPFSGVKGTQAITPQMRHLIEDIQNCRAVGPMRSLLIQSRVLELVALQIDQFRTPYAASETMSANEAEKLYHLKAYLETNFLAEHSLHLLSRHCGLNEFKVKKGFKQLFGTTVFNYLRKLRMDYAGQLLRHHSLSIDEVSDRLGYEHSQHFSIAFKKYTGFSPSHYQHRRAS